MAKNPNRKSKPVKRDDPMNGAMKFFLAGLVAELYLLIIRRFYVNGTAVQMIAWFDYLFYFSIAGLVILAAGAVLSAVWRADQKKRTVGWYMAGGGAFLAAASFLIWKLNAPALTFLMVLVAVAMMLGILVAAVLADTVGKLHLLPAGADTLPIYVACALSAAAMACALVSVTVAYYAMWLLAMVVFALAVYYTVKQL